MRRRRYWQPGIILVLAFVGVGALLAGMYWLLQQFFSPAVSLSITLGVSGAFLFLWAIAGGYRYNWRWTGVGQYSTPPKGTREWHHRKTLWDWMQLLIVPAVLAGGALLFNAQSARTQNELNMRNAQTQQELAADNQREIALQAYINNMSDHLLDDGLRASPQGAEIRSVARTRTLSTLRQLDGARKGQLIQFLSESGLITNTNTSPDPIISLSDASLRGASLRGAELFGAELFGAELEGAFLIDASLEGVDLSRASITNEQLAACFTLRGATLPDGTTVPEDVDNPFR